MNTTVTNEEKLEELAEFFKALSHPVRLKIISILIEGKQCVKNLGEVLNMSQPSVSQHLSILRSRGIVGWKREGSIICYYIKDDRILKLYDMLIKEEL
ncbi:metalloregulator ArsR/SmtB family transcription factor [Hydrogenivirga sp. 128-5-R1-1]|uniref:ArsR/SmtB family transcription factor n=1 Tax=Hydrogenivirga sp. 128-5-R1-1 TaxID=392423 RepID=UPI00015F1756|nr:metalloregulator ArsR/SmtB family transcription factor [Hydrogenivirga sp. 128-5-R1-1]EDP76158.1 transcriptional regulator, ArsR family protein [Hydrogenivirga sp. 128-5-R1-1]